MGIISKSKVSMKNKRELKRELALSHSEKSKMTARRISSGQGSLEAAHMTCVGRDTWRL